MIKCKRCDLYWRGARKVIVTVTLIVYSNHATLPATGVCHSCSVVNQN